MRTIQIVNGFLLVNESATWIICRVTLFFLSPLSCWNAFCFLIIVIVQLQLFAIQMPFSENGGNRLDFQKKSERSSSTPLYSLAKTTMMCYVIVTKWLCSLLVFAKERILLQFYDVRNCRPRISVSFL
jgi:hypothetical protein